VSGVRLNRQQARRLAFANGAARCALGIVALARPGVPLTPWVGDASRTPAPRLLARALGGRDLALGLGALIALGDGGPVRGWLEAAALADAVDTLVTLGALRASPGTARRGRLAVLAAAGTGVAAAVLAARHVDEPAHWPRPAGCRLADAHPGLRPALLVQRTP
jgi:hypothetical protein